MHARECVCSRGHTHRNRQTDRHSPGGRQRGQQPSLPFVTCRSVCLCASVCPSVSPSSVSFLTHIFSQALSTTPPQSVCLSECIYLRLSVCLPVSLRVYLPVSLRVCLSPSPLLTLVLWAQLSSSPVFRLSRLPPPLLLLFLSSRYRDNDKGITSETPPGLLRPWDGGAPQNSPGF